MNLTDQTVVVELTQLKEQVRAIGGNVSDIKEALSALTSLDKNIAELAIHHEQTQKSVQLLWKLHKESQAWQIAHEREAAASRKGFTESLGETREEFSEEILRTDRKVEAWVNQAKGAAWSFGIILGVVQVVVLSAVAWVFTNVTTLREQDTIQKIQIQRLEEQQREEPTQ